MISLGHTLQDELKEKIVSMGWKRHKGFPETGLELGLEGLAKKKGGRKAFKAGDRANAKIWK